jgi:uncharacterized protein YoxC
MLETLGNLDPMTLSGVLLGGMGALSTAVVHLYKSQNTLQKDVNEKVSKELDECRDDRRDLSSALIEINPEAEALRKVK